MPEFTMPQLGESVAEGTITKWLKKEGDSIEVDEALVEVSTDKVDSEIPSPLKGIVTKIMAAEGDTVEVGAVLALIGDETGKAHSAAPSTKKETAAAEETPSKSDVAPAASGPRGSVLSPLVRKLAAERRIDLSKLAGTGAGGRITRQDVEAAASKAPTNGLVQPPAKVQPETRSPKTPAKEGDELVSLTPMRKAIAQHMVASLHETARAWNTVEVDMTAVGRLRKLAGPAFKKANGFSLTWTPFVARAVVEALGEFPQVNSTWNGDGTITRKHYVNLGIAVALEKGLIVPVIKGAGDKDIGALAASIRDIAERARNKKLLPDEVHGGTFTITNPGPFGSLISVPIINQGQAAILAFDSINKRPVVITGPDGTDSIAVREMVYLSLSWDHRLIDGAEAAQFLSRLKSILEAADFGAALDRYLPK